MLSYEWLERFRLLGARKGDIGQNKSTLTLFITALTSTLSGAQLRVARTPSAARG